MEEDKEVLKRQGEAMKTGGGPPQPPPSEGDSLVLRILGENSTRHHNHNIIPWTFKF